MTLATPVADDPTPAASVHQVAPAVTVATLCLPRMAGENAETRTGGPVFAGPPVPGVWIRPLEGASLPDGYFMPSSSRTEVRKERSEISLADRSRAVAPVPLGPKNFAV